MSTWRDLARYRGMVPGQSRNALRSNKVDLIGENALIDVSIAKSTHQTAPDNATGGNHPIVAGRLDHHPSRSKPTSDANQNDRLDILAAQLKKRPEEVLDTPTPGLSSPFRRKRKDGLAVQYTHRHVQHARATSPAPGGAR